MVVCSTQRLWAAVHSIQSTNQDEADELQGCIGEDGDMWDYESLKKLKWIARLMGVGRFYILWQPFYGRRTRTNERSLRSSNGIR